MPSLSPRTKNKVIKLPEEVRAALEAATISGTLGRQWHLKLVGQLDRDTYVKTDKVIKAAGGKWNRSAGAHLFDTDPREVLGLAVAGGEIVDRKKSLGQFFTPTTLARYVVERARITSLDRVLEPSAGSGRIADAILSEASGVDLVCVEIDPVLAQKLREEYGPCAQIVEADFLDTPAIEAALGSSSEGFDVVIMNPPFLGNEGVRHILRAYSLLEPGGRLYAIAPKGAETGSTIDHARLARLIDDSAEMMGEVEDLPEDSFAEAGTRVRTVLISLYRPMGDL
jgi:phospholipid N-methyltransferase